MALPHPTAVSRARDAQTESGAIRYCGRLFALEEFDLIRRLMSAQPKANRAQLSRQVCRELGWLTPDGRSKEMSCRVAMLRMHSDGLITLPPPLKGNGNGRLSPRFTDASAPREQLVLAAGAFGPLELRIVETPQDSALYNELVHRHHYLGYKPLPGAQLRYLVFGGEHLLAALGFGAAAWTVAPRDKFIGWTNAQRLRNLGLVVNNARFLILPWIVSQNLASRILGAVVKRLPTDWENRYGYRPVLAETFVETARFRGTCYRAANWIRVGQTQGRGKLDRYTRRLLPVKDVFLYPLRSDFRESLCSQ